MDLKNIFSFYKKGSLNPFQRMPYSIDDIRNDPQKFNRKIIRKVTDGDAWLCNKTMNNWEMQTGQIKLESFPTALNFPIVNAKCNARCITCSDSFIQSKASCLSVHDILIYEKLLTFAEQVGLVGVGETLLHPKLNNIIDYISEDIDYRCILYTITNGILLDKKFDQIKKLTDIQVSINAATKKTHMDFMRTGECFDKVLNGIRKAVKYREDTGRGPKVKISAVVCQMNIHEIPDFIKLGEDLGIDTIQLNPIIERPVSQFGRFCNKSTSEYNELKLKKDEKTLKILAKIKETAEISGTKVFVTVEGQKTFELERNTNPSPDYFCPLPFNTAFSCEPKGELQPCCIMEDPSPYKYPVFDGSVDFMEVWNGEFFTNLRKGFVDKDIWEDCSNCLNTVNNNIELWWKN